MSTIDDQMKTIEGVVGTTKPVPVSPHRPPRMSKLERQAYGRRLVKEWQAEYEAEIEALAEEA